MYCKKKKRWDLIKLHIFSKLDISSNFYVPNNQMSLPFNVQDNQILLDFGVLNAQFHSIFELLTTVQ